MSRHNVVIVASHRSNREKPLSQHYVLTVNAIDFDILKGVAESETMENYFPHPYVKRDGTDESSRAFGHPCQDGNVMQSKAQILKICFSILLQKTVGVIVFSKSRAQTFFLKIPIIFYQHCEGRYIKFDEDMFRLVSDGNDENMQHCRNAFRSDRNQFFWEVSTSYMTKSPELQAPVSWYFWGENPMCYSFTD